MEQKIITYISYGLVVQKLLDLDVFGCRVVAFLPAPKAKRMVHFRDAASHVPRGALSTLQGSDPHLS